MNLSNEFQPIRDWAEKRGLLAQGDIKTQTLKLVEEVGELAKGIIEDKSGYDVNHDIIDAIGDCVVVLTSIAHFAGTPIEHCINHAYKVIANRTGEMRDGTWVRDKE